MPTIPSLFVALVAMILPFTMTAESAQTAVAVGFSGFDQRAQAGEHLNVVFFGCSLTWGANASDPSLTSYRAVVQRQLEEYYPNGHFRCFDGAIGGTNSILGVHRVDRDALRHDPDLVFVDFTANDDVASGDQHTLASYEAILRRFAERGIPVVQVAFPFKWDADRERLPKMVRLRAHHTLAEDYGNGWGDAITHVMEVIESGRVGIDEIWVTDGVHPHDAGYRLFAEAAWQGYLDAVAGELVPQVPEQMRYGDAFVHAQRVRLSSLAALPAGWEVGAPNLVAMNHDWLMSRWLDDLVIARNHAVDRRGKPKGELRPVGTLRLKVSATSILLFGEATPQSGCFRVRIDGVVVTGNRAQRKDTDLFDANRWKTGIGHLAYEVVRDLSPDQEHLIEIEPVFENDEFHDLRIESICVAGGKATIAVAE
jgi:lysophospholipase L1-like esterase